MNRIEIINRMSDDIINWEYKQGECFLDYHFSGSFNESTWTGFLIGKGFADYALKCISAYVENSVDMGDYVSMFGYYYELEDDKRKEVFKLCAEFILAIPRMRINYNEFIKEGEYYGLEPYYLEEIKLPEYE